VDWLDEIATKMLGKLRLLASQELQHQEEMGEVEEFGPDDEDKNISPAQYQRNLQLFGTIPDNVLIEGIKNIIKERFKQLVESEEYEEDIYDWIWKPWFAESGIQSLKTQSHWRLGKKQPVFGWH
jgi:hypothetical protein